MKNVFLAAFLLLLVIKGSTQNGFVKIASLNFDWVEENCYENRIAFKQNDKYGFCDSTGAIKISAQYSNYNSFENGYAKVTADGRNYFYINTKGDPIYNRNQEPLTPIGKDGFCRVSDNQIFFYNKRLMETGALEVKMVYAGDYADGLIPVLNNDNLWGFANLEPNMIIPCAFKSITPFKDGLAVLSKGESNENKRGVINTKGEVVVPFEYHMIFRMQNHFILEKNQQLTAFDISKMSMVTEPLEMRYYNYMNLFTTNFKIAKNSKGALALFNNQLKQECVISYDDCRLADDKEGLVAVKKNDLWGLIDHNGNEIAACEYEDIGTMQNGLIKVTKQQIIGFLNKTGQMIIPLQFTRSGSFYSKFITAKYKGSNVLIRPKSAAELKQETVLIEQKKLPTAEECFEMALLDAGLKQKQTTTVSTSTGSGAAQAKELIKTYINNMASAVKSSAEITDALLTVDKSCWENSKTNSKAASISYKVYDKWYATLDNLKQAHASLEKLSNIRFAPFCKEWASLELKISEAKTELSAFINTEKTSGIAKRLRDEGKAGSWADIWYQTVKEMAGNNQSVFNLFGDFVKSSKRINDLANQCK